MIWYTVQQPGAAGRPDAPCPVGHCAHEECLSAHVVAATVCPSCDLAIGYGTAIRFARDAEATYKLVPYHRPCWLALSRLT